MSGRQWEDLDPGQLKQRAEGAWKLGPREGMFPGLEDSLLPSQADPELPRAFSVSEGAGEAAILQAFVYSVMFPFLKNFLFPLWIVEHVLSC